MQRSVTFDVPLVFGAVTASINYRSDAAILVSVSYISPVMFMTNSYCGRNALIKQYGEMAQG